MKSPFLKNIRYPGKFITLSLLCILVIETFKVAIDSGMQKTVAEPSRVHLQGICGAIAGLKYDQEGYICPKEIYERLEGIEMFFNKTTQEINQIIKEATELKISNSQEGFTSGETDPGYVDYTYLAFMLFGFRIESLLYLYFLLFIISVFVFWVTFRRSPIGSFIIILFLLAHYVVVKAAPGIGYNLANVVNYRFLPVLAILSIIHISMLSLLGNRLNGYTLIGALLQSIIILFSIWIRGSAIWVVILLVFFAVIKPFFNLMKPKVSLNTPQGVLVGISSRIIKFRLWPIGLFLFLFIFLFIGKPFILGAKYNKNSSTGYHLVWHSIYVGLALHPDIREKFSNVRADDNFDINKYYDLVIGHDETRQDGVYKAAAREWLRKNSDISKRVLLLKKKYDFKEKDAYGYDAAFKWLKDHNMSEYYFFNFNPGDGVNYYSAFPTWFKDKKQLNIKREFRFQSDLKWPVYDEILAKITKEVVVKSPLEVMQVIFFIKPILFLSNYFNYFGVFTNLPPPFLIVLVILHVYFILGGEWQDNRLRLLLFLGTVFIFSMIPAILIYPGSYVIADSALVFTMCIFIIFFSFINTRITRFTDTLEKWNSPRLREG